ncbi:MAG TPA: TIGR03016 family PEP-CTERM system-associated outer membrane protein [Geobacteraceae bacterium]|nr:TIGR03016 family PEP-CTERM system-associated outer membrane protein [Geobacteraceae bacterium]
MHSAKCGVMLAMLAVSLGFSSSAWAEFRFSPGISIREEYNDNVNLDDTDKQEDFITTINPNLNLYYGGELLNFYLDYGLRYLIYARNTEDDELYHNVNLQSTIRPFKDYFFIRISDFFSRVPIDQRRQVGYENNLANLTNSNVFSVNPYFEYPLSATFKIKGGYTYQNSWYESKDGDDSQDHTASIGVSKELSSRISTSLFYDYQFHRPEMDFDTYDRQGATLGLNFGLTEKLHVDGSIGWVRFDYKTLDGRDFSAINWSANARYLLSPAITLRAGYARNYFDTSSQTPSTAGSFIAVSDGSIYPGEGYVIIDGQAIPASAVQLDSIGGGLYRNDSITAGLIYSGKITVNVSGFRNIIKYESIDRENRSTGVNLGVTIPLTSRLSAQMSGLYSYNKYRPENETVNRYGARLNFDYTLKITTLTLGYAFNKDDSDVEGQDYTNNVVWISARFMF